MVLGEVEQVGCERGSGRVLQMSVEPGKRVAEPWGAWGARGHSPCLRSVGGAGVPQLVCGLEGCEQ